MVQGCVSLVRTCQSMHSSVAPGTAATTRAAAALGHCLDERVRTAPLHARGAVGRALVRVATSLQVRLAHDKEAAASMDLFMTEC